MRAAAQSTSKIGLDDSSESQRTRGANVEEMLRLRRRVAILAGVRHINRRLEVSMMFSRVLLSIAACVGTGGQALAQDAAETAIILGGSGAAQGKASRALGSAAANSMGAAANAIRPDARPAPAIRRSSRRAQQVITLPGDVDALENTDAPTYELANGASIRVSGVLRPQARTVCDDACAD